jgi:opacity protein-like surface antigen
MKRSTHLAGGLSGLAGLLTAIFVFTTVAMAQVEHPSQVSFQGTALITKDSTSDLTSTSHRSTESGGLLVGYSYQFNRWAGAEGAYGFSRNTQKYFGAVDQSSIEANIHEVTGSFLLHIPVRAEKAKPYALAGGGALIFDPTNRFPANGVDRQTKAAFVYGGGFDFDLTPNFGVRAEYRGLVYKVPDFTLNSLNLDKVTHLAQPSVGFFVRF